MTTPDLPERADAAGGSSRAPMAGRPGWGAGLVGGPDAAGAAGDSAPRPVSSVRLALLALRGWTPAHVVSAVVASVAIGLVMGVATVLIPNSWFARNIPPVWWNYPVWVVTSVLAGMLVATYARGSRAAGASDPDGDSDDSGPLGSDAAERRTGRFGIAGGVLAWFSVGCPVCNKLALLALGYSGAITWFAPLQPVLAVAGLVLVGVALVWRLRGQVACPMPAAGVGEPIR